MIAERLSFQLYSARKYPPLEAQLDLVAGLGLRHVEPYGGLLGEASKLAAALAERGLTAPSCHISIEELEDGLAVATSVAGELGIGLYVVPAIAADMRPGDTVGWHHFGRRLANLQARLAARNLRLAWHNHGFEFARLADGRRPLEVIFGAAPSLLWEADIGWIERAGEQAATWIERYRERIAAFHIKDIAPPDEAEDEDGWADIGHGIVDWQRLVPMIAASPAEIIVLEHDNPSDYRRFAERSVETVKGWA